VFGIDFSEALIIAIVALVVLGPERLPKAARMAGTFMRKARNSFESLKIEVERELEAEEFKRNLAAIPKPQDILNEVMGDIRKPLQLADAPLPEPEPDATPGDASAHSPLNTSLNTLPNTPLNPPKSELPGQ
jgi:sec-independent protein translocase protein TatB